jgi:flagellar hook protein FlgE
MMNGVSGLRANSQRMDVISNDIANLNTTGYKQTDVTFKEQLVSTIRTPSIGAPGQQVGMGVQIGNISRNFSNGITSQTGVASNVAIAGNGFFTVGDTAGNHYYTRAGDFTHDLNATAADGSFYLINSDGMRLRGVQGAAAIAAGGVANSTMTDILIPAGTASYSVGQNGTLTCYDGSGAVLDTWQVGVSMFANNNGLKSEGANLYSFTSAADNAEMAYQGGLDGAGVMYQGYLEASNVDLSQEFTEMILTQRAFQANSKSITTGDEMLQELLTLKR